jgi:hypothetical protein
VVLVEVPAPLVVPSGPSESWLWQHRLLRPLTCLGLLLFHFFRGYKFDAAFLISNQLVLCFPPEWNSSHTFIEKDKFYILILRRIQIKLNKKC